MLINKNTEITVLKSRSPPRGVTGMSHQRSLQPLPGGPNPAGPSAPRIHLGGSADGLGDRAGSLLRPGWHSKLLLAVLDSRVARLRKVAVKPAERLVPRNYHSRAPRATASAISALGWETTWACSTNPAPASPKMLFYMSLI